MQFHVVGAVTIYNWRLTFNRNDVPYVLCHDFDVDIEPVPMFISQAGRQRRRIVRAFIDVVNSGVFNVDNQTRSGRKRSSDVETVPPLATQIVRVSQKGSSEDRSLRITQRRGEGAPLHVRAITMEIRAR